MSGRFARRKGERGIIIAVERCMNRLEELRTSKKLVSRLKFEQSVRELAKAIPEEWQDSEFIDSLYQICLDLIERNGIAFPRDKLKS